MSRKCNLIHLDCSAKTQLCRESLLSPEAGHRTSDHSYRHGDPFVLNNLVCFYKVCSVTIIINASHFVTLPSHTSSSPGDENNFHDVSFLDFIFLFISIALNQLHLPQIALTPLKILTIVKPLVPPKSIIRYLRLKPSC